MPSPVGHILGGATLFLAGTNREYRSKVMFSVIFLGSVLPDFDFLPGILIGHPAAFHHGISHSLTFAALFGVLIFFIVCRFENKKIAVRAGILAGLAYASHLALDLVSVNEGARGIPIIWPISSDRFGVNLQLFGHFHHGRLAQGIWSVVRWENLTALSREVTVLGVPLLLLFWRERRDRSTVQTQR
jgi:membrane-bound metal-dependent hydrolase YbcI (DUF457 family)